MDLLIISISGAGIYSCSELGKYLIDKNIVISGWLKLSAALLVISIISNFISQWLASRTHHEDYCSLLSQLDDEHDEKCSKEEIISFYNLRNINIEEYESKAEKFNRFTIKFNNFSIGFMISGLIIFILHVCFIF
ncbi:hypothetical protein FIA58_011825 [Flavobacterium jejuense]|uniref:SMODS and SLOG-associating 2TM effector domain-containing protein n=1 Tax=Flavobacterium jejuense TaxID=1544455 RepID=A0ABX0IRA1_9FLAO|nr:hypothetical protein [Flavobacterium jejuense]NHN26369.1 hypothetical protein [Flavobacterium jejuense]